MENLSGNSGNRGGCLLDTSLYFLAIHLVD